MKKLLIIGGGNMGYAIAHGLVSQHVYTSSSIVFVEKSKLLKRFKFLKEKGFKVFTQINDTFSLFDKQLELVILAVKPSDRDLVLSEIKKSNRFLLPVVSILAGVKIKTLASRLLPKQPLARVMPNTPILVGEGMSVLTFNKYISEQAKSKILQIFNAVGKTLILSENKFDIVTALSGSGPAYFCYLIESLEKEASKFGISKENAYNLVLQTAFGTIKLLKDNNLKPEVLRKMVTSRKGTTDAALRVFNKNKFSNIINMALRAAVCRSNQLGKF